MEVKLRLDYLRQVSKATDLSNRFIRGLKPKGRMRDGCDRKAQTTSKDQGSKTIESRLIMRSTKLRWYKQPQQMLITLHP